MLRRAVAALQFTVRFAQGFLDEDVGQGRNFRRGLGQGRDLEHVAQHDADILPPFKPRQRERNIGFERTRPEARQTLVKLFLGKAAVEVLLPEKGWSRSGFWIRVSPKNRLWPKTTIA